MEKSTILFSVCLLMSCLVATSTSNYIFNGYRGLFGGSSTTDKNDNNINNNNVQETTTTVGNEINSHNEVYTSNRCVQRSLRDFRPVPGKCSQFQLCTRGVLITYNCPSSAVFNKFTKECVPKGSRYDTCTEDSNSPKYLVSGGDRPFRPISQLTTACPRGVTYKKAHPIHCARYYDCGRPAMMDRWEDHEWECKYPFLFNEDTKRCEHYSMVSCGTRKVAYDRCDYKAYSCNGHAHCRPCSVQYPSCRDLPDGMNEWKGRTPSPYYVVCADHRVVYSGSCPTGQLFDGKTGTCKIMAVNRAW